MALLKGKKFELPPDAVILTEEEAFQYQTKILADWSRTSDIFAYKYGGRFLGLMSGLTGAIINSHYRFKFKLLSYGRGSSYLPVIVIPSMISFLFHTEMVLPDVVLQKNCVVCTEMRASALQAITSTVIPTTLSSLSAFSLAMRYGTENLPYITKEPKKVFKLWMAKTKPFGNTLFTLFVLNAFLASVVTYFEAKSVETCNNKLNQIEMERQKMLHN